MGVLYSNITQNLMAQPMALAVELLVAQTTDPCIPSGKLTELPLSPKPVGSTESTGRKEPSVCGEYNVGKGSLVLKMSIVLSLSSILTGMKGGEEPAFVMVTVLVLVEKSLHGDM